MNDSRARLLRMLAGLSLLCPAAHAQENGLDVALRAIITAADGEPANDIPGYGVLAHYVPNERWTLGAAIDRTEYDFEEPAKLIGIVQDPALGPVDAKAEATIVSLWIERTFSGPRRPTVWFLGVGVGAASVDVPNAVGPRSDGGRFDIRTEVDTEIIACLIGGLRRKFGDRWYVEFALRADRHFADWQITDRVTGAQGSVGDYLALGGHVGVGRRF